MMNPETLGSEILAAWQRILVDHINMAEPLYMATATFDIENNHVVTILRRYQPGERISTTLNLLHIQFAWVSDEILEITVGPAQLTPDEFFPAKIRIHQAMPQKPDSSTILTEMPIPALWREIVNDFKLVVCTRYKFQFNIYDFDPTDMISPINWLCREWLLKGGQAFAHKIQ